MTENDPEEKLDTAEDSAEYSPEDSQNETKTEEEDDELDIEELAKEYQAQEKEPRPMPVQILISLSFLFGPIFLVIDIFSDSFLGPFGNALSYIVIAITGGLIGAILFQAWRLSTEME